MIGKKEYLSYPFLHEKKDIVDFELITDELSSYLGLAVSLCHDNELKDELIKVATLVYHLNPCVRKNTCLEEEETKWLWNRYENYLYVTKDRDSLFVLPTGTTLASTLHICRTKAKHVVRLMYKLLESGIEVKDGLFDFSNVLANYLFTAAMYANKLDNHQEIPFQSRVYK